LIGTHWLSICISLTMPDSFYQVTKWLPFATAIRREECQACIILTAEIPVNVVSRVGKHFSSLSSKAPLLWSINGTLKYPPAQCLQFVCLFNDTLAAGHSLASAILPFHVEFSKVQQSKNTAASIRIMQRHNFVCSSLLATVL